MTNVIVVIGAGSIGQAIVRRVAAGKLVLLADIRQENADAAAKTLSDAGFNVTTATVDVSSRASVHALVEMATKLGEVFGVIHAAGVSPSQASTGDDPQGRSLRNCARIGRVRKRHCSRRRWHRHRLPVRPSPAATINRTERSLATAPVDELLALPMLQPDQIKDSLHAYQISKRGNSLRVMAEAVRWGKRGARVNTISPGIIITPLANDELKGPRGPGYRRMLEVSAAGRAGTPDEVGTVGALLMGPTAHLSPVATSSWMAE